MAKQADYKAQSQKVQILGSQTEVTTIQTSPTVFEAYGEFNGSQINATATSRSAALARWCELAAKSAG